MIPVYEAIDIIGDPISANSGHNRPLKVIAYTPQGAKHFVVKPYTTSQVDAGHCVTNEIICNILGREFDFKVPDCALIDIPEDLVYQKGTEIQQLFNSADFRLKFATVELQGVFTASHLEIKKQCASRIDIDTLYAFDNMILNSDRGFPKPNLLIDSEDAYIIDHELTFDENAIRNFDFIEGRLEQRYSKNHLFHSTLCKTRNKLNIFDDFSFYLQSLNPDILNPYFQQLKDEGFNDYSELILGWLSQIKQKNTIFVNCLKSSLQ